MYKEHRIFSLPANEEIIWRYMDFYKFEDLITTNKLYMASINKMGDQYESEVPENLRKKFIEHAKQTQGEDYAIGLQKTLEPSDKFKKETYISSWNNQPVEPYALWKIYTTDAMSVAIRSTINRLKNSFNNEKDHDQYIGKIRYHDGVNYTWRGNLYDPVLYKWNYYDFENEVRVVTSFYAKDYEALKTHPEGLKVSIDCDELIDCIYMAPNATDLEHSNVFALLQGANLGHKEIYQSGIRDKWSNR